MRLSWRRLITFLSRHINLQTTQKHVYHVPEAFFHPHQTELFVCLLVLEFETFCHNHEEPFFYRNPQERDLTEIKGKYVFSKIQWASKNFYGLCLKFQKLSYLSYFRALPDYFSKLSGFRTFFIPNP